MYRIIEDRKKRAYMMHFLIRKVHPLLLPYAVVESRKIPKKMK